jgi:two-component system CheB/CheR fusion protein
MYLAIAIIIFSLGLFYFFVRQDRSLIGDTWGSLEVSRSHLISMFNNMPFGMLLVSSEGDILEVNKKIEDILERPKEVIKTMNLMDLSHPDDLIIHHHNFDNLVSRKIDFYQLEKRQVLPNHNTIWVRLTASSLDPRQGIYLFFVENIQKLKTTKKSLDISEKLAKFGTWSIDLKTGDSSWSSGIYDILNLDKNIEPSGDVALNLIHPKDKDNICSQVENIDLENYFSFESRVVHPTGSVKYTQTTGTLVYDYRNAPEKIVGSLWDITKFKESEKELNASNKELEQFAYIASHDLQEPLRQINNHIQMLNYKCKEMVETDDKTKKHINFVKEGVRKMHNLIQDLLQYSRHIHNKPLHLYPIKVQSIINKAIHELGACIEESNAKILMQKEKSFPTIRTEEVVLKQVFYNLISNSIKFRSNEDLVIKIRFEDSWMHWIFYVEDNGIGIASEHHEIIFKMFQRLNKRKEGSGMGLAFSKRALERLGGNLTVSYSEIGKGSIFKIEIPKKSKFQEKE